MASDQRGVTGSWRGKADLAPGRDRGRRWGDGAGGGCRRWEMTVDVILDSHEHLIDENVLHGGAWVCAVELVERAVSRDLAGILEVVIVGVDGPMVRGQEPQ